MSKSSPKCHQPTRFQLNEEREKLVEKRKEADKSDLILLAVSLSLSVALYVDLLGRSNNGDEKKSKNMFNAKKHDDTLIIDSN